MSRYYPFEDFFLYLTEQRVSNSLVMPSRAILIVDGSFFLASGSGGYGWLVLVAGNYYVISCN